MIVPFKLGLGGRIGNGRQFYSWIHIHDLMHVFSFVMDQPRISGPVHVAAPEVVTNRQFTASLTKVLRRPAILPVPVFLLYLLYGKAAKTLIEGRGAIPGVLMDNGFHYQFPELRPALADLFGSRK